MFNWFCNIIVLRPIESILYNIDCPLVERRVPKGTWVPLEKRICDIEERCLKKRDLKKKVLSQDWHLKVGIVYIIYYI